jgi:hypothetical protein
MRHHFVTTVQPTPRRTAATLAPKPERADKGEINHA